MGISAELFPPWLLPGWMNKEKESEGSGRQKEREIDDTAFYDQVLWSHAITCTICNSVEHIKVLVTKTNLY